MLSMLHAAARNAGYLAFGTGPLFRRRLKRIQQERPLVVLNLHRLGTTPPARLDATRFSELLRFAQAHFEVTTFSELGRPSAKPRLILSFDDGYRDFIEVAAPLLREHGLRVNLNVIPSCVDSGLPPTNVMAQEFIARAPDDLTDKLDIPGFDPGRREGRADRLNHFVKTQPHADRWRTRDILLRQASELDGFAFTEMMSRNEVREAAKDHEIGAHSFDHDSMWHESDDYLLADLERCRSWFAEVLGRPLDIYAFPNGSCRPGQIELLQQAGIRHILLTGDTFALREGVHARFSFTAASSAEMRFRALGKLERIPLRGSRDSA
jgi:peptidoglycan/xylan/chitin deacetylase (PgdA/CDA1 family)